MKVYITNLYKKNALETVTWKHSSGIVMEVETGYRWATAEVELDEWDKSWVNEENELINEDLTARLEYTNLAGYIEDAVDGCWTECTLMSYDEKVMTEEEAQEIVDTFQEEGPDDEWEDTTYKWLIIGPYEVEVVEEED